MSSIQRLTPICFLLGVLGGEYRSSAAERPAIAIGVSDGAVQDIPKVFRATAAEPILKLMNDSTGVRGKLSYFSDPMVLASDMNDGKIQIGIFQGHEFAWAQEKYGDLVPIVISIPMNPIQSFCVVRSDRKAQNIGDLAREKVSLPPNRPEICDMFIAKQKQEHLKSTDFAGQIDAPTASDALFDVIEGKASCTFIDAATLKYFEATQPGAYKNLRILAESPLFPNACIAVKKGRLDEKTIEKFRKTLLDVQNLPGGPPLLTAMKLTSFRKVPDDYETALKSILKQYPAPTPARVTQSSINR